MSVSNTTLPVKEVRRQWASISLITSGSSILAIILTSPPHLLRLLVCSKDRYWPILLKNSRKKKGYMEAAHYGAIWNPRIKRFYQRKQAKAHILMAKKAVANKLARACYHMLKRGEAFDVTRAFS